MLVYVYADANRVSASQCDKNFQNYSVTTEKSNLDVFHYKVMLEQLTERPPTSTAPESSR